MNIEIIPAIDIIDGKCVRLSQGDYNRKKIYSENPLNIAKEFESIGIKRLHLIDLDGAKAKHIVNHKTLETIASKTNLIIDFGGGIKSDNDIQKAFDYGADMVTGGSIAIKSRETFLKWLQKYGSDKIILGADIKDNMIAISGWLEITDTDIFSFLEYYTQKGIKNVLCTDISKDGMLAGTAVEIYDSINKSFDNINLIASGGVSSKKDIEDLESINIKSVIVGKAIYEGTFNLKEYMSKN